MPNISSFLGYIGDYSKNFFNNFDHQYSLRVLQDNTSVGDITDIRWLMTRNINRERIVKIKWKDPQNLTVDNGEVMVRWKTTYLVRKAGSYPESMEDGEIVVSNQVRDYYNDNVFVDRLPLSTNGEEDDYYYQFFSLSENNIIRINTEDPTANRIHPVDMDWEKISEVIKTGEALALGLNLGDVLMAHHSEFGDIPFKIMGYDMSDISYKDNPNNGAIHSMTLWSNTSLCNKAFDAPESKYAFMEGSTFRKDFILKMYLCDYTNNKTLKATFIIYDKLMTGYSRKWVSKDGKYLLKFDILVNKWKVIDISTGTEYCNSKAFPNEPSDNVDITQDINTINSDDLKWNTYNGLEVIVVMAKEYYLKEGDVYTVAPVNHKSLNSPDTFYEEIIDDDSFNRTTHGYGNWKQSAIRKYANSDAEASNTEESTWWTKSSIWDVAPDYKLEAGFLNGFSQNFLSHLATVKNYTLRDTVCSGGGFDVTYDKVYLPSYKNLFNKYESESKIDGNENVCPEDHFFPYIESIDEEERFFEILKTTQDGESRTNFFTRSCNPTSSSAVISTDTQGEPVTTSQANHISGFCPVLTII